MVSANGNTPIIFLSDAAEPRCIRNGLKSGEAAPSHHASGAASGSLLVLRGAGIPLAPKPAFGTGQVAEYGRLRLASIQPEK
jgi:hypothetical protein